MASIKACAAACFPTYSFKVILNFFYSANERAAMPEKRIIVKFRIYATFGVLREIVWTEGCEKQILK